MPTLGELAREVRGRAYAPYSGYLVGAALRTPTGEVFVGANVESVSYGATLCAERGAVAAMAAAGGREIAEIAVATEDGGTPCGICLQVLTEFAPPTALVRCVGADAERVFALGELAPHIFASAAVLGQSSVSGGSEEKDGASSGGGNSRPPPVR